MSTERATRRRSLLGLPEHSRNVIRKVFSRASKSVSKVESELERAPRSPRTWLAGLGPEKSGYDARLIPQLIDRIALKRPHATWVSIPKTSDPHDGFKDITYRELSHAVNRAAVWLEAAIGQGVTGQKIAYLSGSQASSIMVTLAACKLGCQMLFLSPRNSLEGQLSLIDQVGCRFLATPRIQLPQTEAILTERSSLKHIISPGLDDFLKGPVPSPRPFVGAFDELRHKVFWYTHSSGTTSLPKPVGWTHGANAGLLYELLADYVDGRMVLQDMAARSTRIFSAFPIFHAAGMIFPLLEAAMTGMECVLPPQNVPLTAELADKMHISVKAPMAVLEPPIITEELVKDPVYFKNLLHQSIIMTGAAALPKTIGDKILQHGLAVRNMVASSETGIPPLLVPNPESEWQAFSFAAGQGLEMKHVKDEQYELIYHKLKGSSRIQPVFENYPHLDVYRTKDMFVKHPDPEKSHLWVIAGRADDVIVLLNGEKFTPTALEEHIQAQVGVKGALVFGVSRDQASLLIEPADESITSSPALCHSFVEKMWPAIELANSKIAAHGRIHQTHVLLTKVGKPMLRTPKGSIQRSKTYELYAPEMDELYAKFFSDAKSETTAVVGTESLDLATLDLKRRICKLVGLAPARLDEDDNIFSAGFDSLHAVQLTRQLQGSFGKNNFEQVMIYNNPTIRQLSFAISGRCAPRKISQDNDVNINTGPRFTTTTSVSAPTYDASSIESLLSAIAPSLPTMPTGKVVLLTGSSGGLGQHLLEQLRAAEFTHIYCLLRTPTPRNTPPSPPSLSKASPLVTYLQTNLSAPLLGLPPSMYNKLLCTTTHVIHNAWLVDFNQPLSFFTSNVDSVRGLIAFAATARQNPHIFFISSISSVAAAAPSDPPHPTPIPETIESSSFTNPSPAPTMGYAASKRAAELLLDSAVRTSGIKATILRVGQIAGTSEPGFKSSFDHSRLLPSWQKRDWFPRLLASAQILGAIPDSLGALSCDGLSWMPVDRVARVCVELLNADGTNKSETVDRLSAKADVFHIANEHDPAHWETLLPTVRRVIGGGDMEKIAVVNPNAWVSILEASLEGGRQSAAAQLLEFYRGVLLAEKGMGRFDTSRTMKRSVAMRETGCVTERQMAQWIGEWFGEDATSTKT